MAKYYEEFKTIIFFSAFVGIYFPAVEKLYGAKWYIKSLKICAFLSISILSVFAILTAKAALFDEVHMGRRLQGVGLVTFSTYTTYSASIFYISRKDFINLFELWDSLFQEGFFEEERQKLLEHNKKAVTKCFKIFTISNGSASIIYTIVGFFRSSKKVEHITGIPHKDASPDYELIVFFEFFVTFYGFLTLAAYDSIHMIYLALEEAQFKHLQNSLYKTIGILSITESGNTVVDFSQKELRSNLLRKKNLYTKEEIYLYVEDTLRLWVSHHQDILRYQNELQKVLGKQLSVKYFAFILVVCMVTFLSITEGGYTVKDSIVSTLYTINSYALFYINIQYADSIKATAETICGSAFGKTWFLYPKKIQTTFKIIYLQSKRPVQLKTFRIYPLGSKSFRQIMSAAYSFFTFLMQMTRKN